MTTTTRTYSIDLTSLTILVTDAVSGTRDLNLGEACETAEQLADLVIEMREQGAYSATVEQQLLTEIG